MSEEESREENVLIVLVLVILNTLGQIDKAFVLVLPDFAVQKRGLEAAKCTCRNSNVHLSKSRLHFSTHSLASSFH